MKTMNFAGIAKMQRKVDQAVQNQYVTCKLHWTLYNETGAFVTNGTWTETVSRKELKKVDAEASDNTIRSCTFNLSTYDGILEVIFNVFHMIIETPRDYEKCTLKCTW